MRSPSETSSSRRVRQATSSRTCPCETRVPFDARTEASESLKVLQVVQQPALRGAEVFARQLSDALRDRGHSTRTVYLYEARDSGFSVDPGDIVLGARRDHLWERALVQPRVVGRLMRVAEEFAPDVVQLNGGRAVKYGAALRHVKRRAPWVTIYRNIGDPDHWIRGPFKRSLYRVGVFSGVDGIVSLSERASHVFKNTFGVGVPLGVIPTGVSPKHLVPSEDRARVRERLGTPVAAPAVLYVGNLAPEKRLDRLISAFSKALARSCGARLWLVGEGSERSSLEQLSRRLGLEASVSFAGMSRDVASYYAAADLFALTSDTEGIPGVVLEAAYFGLPVVTTDVGHIRECVLDGESGLVVARDDTSIGDALGSLLESADLRRRFGSRGRSFVHQRFLMSDIAQRYERFYRLVLGMRLARR